MSSIVVTNAPFVNLPTEATKGTLSSTTYVSSGTVVVLSDAAYQSLSPTCFTSGNLLFGGTDVGAGYQVDRATNTLPATATGAIFNITGGRVLVTDFFGQVTTALGATVTTLAVGYLPTGGSQQAVGSATAVTSSAAGTMISVVAGAVVVGAATFFDIAQPASSWNFNPGAINITTSATDTGSVKWTVIYKPLDAGAAITAA